jgi:hypothetical protein
MWGARSDVSFALQILALKALAGADPRADSPRSRARFVGGVIIGVGEKIGEFYWGRFSDRASRELARLHDRAGLPAVPSAGTVRRTHHRADLNNVLTVKPGNTRTIYAADMALFPIRQDRDRHRADPAGSLTSASPVTIVELHAVGGHDPAAGILARAIGPQPPHRLYRLISLGTAGLLGVGAYASYKLTTWFPGANVI